MAQLTELNVRWAFFEAMKYGWAGSAPVTIKPRPIEGRPGSHSIEWREDDWLVVDEYYTTSLGPDSDGSTLIWFHENLVWSMRYWGWYREDAISYLKVVLADAYQTRRFCGGRGEPYSRPRGGILYENDYTGDFEKFAGKERLIDTSVNPALRDPILGVHEYSGGLMVKLPIDI